MLAYLNHWQAKSASPLWWLALLGCGLALLMSMKAAFAVSSSPSSSPSAPSAFQQEPGVLDDELWYEGDYEARLWGHGPTDASEQSLPDIATTPESPPPLPLRHQRQVIQLDSVARPSYVFPLGGAPLAKFTKDGRQFGAPRDYGRLHAGVDLLEYPGQAVYAITTGKVVNFQYFYEGSYVVTVDHQRFVVRYAEVKKMYGSLRVGDAVQSGQKIGLVAMLLSGSSMLHLEKYTGKLSGPFYVPSSYPYHRRKDLVNPTSFVHSLENSMLGAR